MKAAMWIAGRRRTPNRRGKRGRKEVEGDSGKPLKQECQTKRSSSFKLVCRMLVLLVLGSVGLLGGIHAGTAKAEPNRMPSNYLAAIIEEESWPRPERRSTRNDCTDKECATSPNISDEC